MRFLSSALLLSLPIFAQQTTLPGDAAQQLLSNPPNAVAKFLSSNAGWQTVSTQSNGIFLKDPSSTKQAAVLGDVAHQDPATGSWVANNASLSSTANGWRLDGGAYQVFIRQSGAAQHVVTQTYTDYSTQHASTLNVTLPKLSYANNFSFGFAQDGLNWNLLFTSHGFFQIRATVAKRIGKATHSFPVTSSEALTINSEGQLVGDTHVGLTAPMIIPRFGKPISCGAWTYSKGAASFTCDDSSLKDNQLPYIIDPQSQTTLTNGGTYNINNWNDGQGDSGNVYANVNFSLTSLSPQALIGVLGCNYNVLDSSLDGPDGIACNIQTAPPYSSTGIQSSNTQVTVNLSIIVNNGDSSYSDNADINDVQLTAFYNNLPAPGTYPNGSQVTISASWGNLSYACNPSVQGCLYSGYGSGNPSTATLTPASGATTTITAYSLTSAWATYGVAQGTYTMISPAATPTASPGGGTYTSPQTVTLSSSTSGASIRYTTDFSTPTETHGTLYTGPFTVSSSVQVWAIAYKSGYYDSSIAQIAYTIETPAGTPTFSPAAGTYASAQSVAISTTTRGATIRYTTDGSTPTETHGTVYSGAITVSAPETLSAIAYETGYDDSLVASAAYVLNVATPTISIAAGTYTTPQSVTISTTTSGATIRYTTDGSAPTETHGTVYSGPVSVSATETLKAIAYLAGWADSSVISAAYTITGTVAAPATAPAAGTYTGAQSITLSTTTSGASIRYTTDGTTPSETNGTLYQGAFTLSSGSNTQATTFTVKAIGYESAWTDSSVATYTFNIYGNAGAPVFTPPGGTYSAGQTVGLSSVTPNAVIRYTLDGSTPSETHGTIYSSPIPVTAAMTVSAIAYETNWLDSAVTVETYYFDNPTGGTGNGNGGSGGGSNTNTPPADSGNGMDPRRTGIRAFGSYWGDAGENIDTISGNLTFGLQLIKPFGRGNWTLPFSLSYNSQMWRADSAGDWLLGQDVGYGMGWKLQIGSLTPIWSSGSVIDHYLFTDSSGAEYTLVNTNGVWASTEGIYITYDPTKNRIYNNDGSFWVMGCTSASGEQDAGTMYPTLAESSNGNYISITYQPGIGSSQINTSARFQSVIDTRTTYQFTYTQLSPNDNIPHLTTISGPPGESWTLTYSASSLNSPISGASFGTTELLASLAQASTATFSYNSSAELTQYVTSLGGAISWGYASNTYTPTSGSLTLREVNTRSMNQGAGGFSNTHALSHPSACESSGGGNFHGCTQIQDGGAGSKKIYYAAAQNSMVLPSEYQETDNNGSTLLLQKTLAWNVSSSSSEFLQEVDATLNPGGSSATTTKTVQSIDSYGNLSQQQVYDYGSSSVSRAYSFTYITDSNYISRYLRSLVSGVSVTSGSGSPIQLMSNTYDGTTTGPLQAYNGFPQHDSTYDTTVTYRGNVTFSYKLGATMGYAYDAGGNVYEAVDGDGMVVASTLDGTGSVPTLLTPNSNANLAASFGYTSFLVPSSSTGPNGATQSVGYDGYNRPIASTSVDGAVTTYTYTLYPSANTQVASTPVTTSTLAQGGTSFTTSTTNLWKRVTYDGFGRTIKVENGHDSNIVDNTVDTVYGACGCSPLGKVVKVSMPYGPGETEVWTTYTYDGSGRQLTSTAPDGSVTSTSYTGNSTTTTDPAGAWKTNVTDAFGNLTAVYEPDPTTGLSSSNYVTYYAYNGANQLTNVYMTRGGVAQNRTFGYNGSDLISETTPEGGTVTYTYDNNHHVTSRTDALNQKTAYTYDGYERLTLVQHYTWGPSPYCQQSCVSQWNEQALQDVNYYYDSPVDGSYTQNYTWGRLSAVTFGSGYQSNNPATVTYEYNYTQAGRIAGNRMLLNAGPAPNLDLQAQYTWDNNGRMTSITYPSGLSMNYAYDVMSRPIYLSTGTYAPFINASATYGSAGKLLTLNGSGQNPSGGLNGMTESFTYNSMMQLTGITGYATCPYGYANCPGPANINMQYGYTAGHNNGRVSSTTDNVLGETVNYTYDYLHRLTGATATNGSWGEAYAYDGFGNLMSKVPTQGSAPAYQGATSQPNATGGALPGDPGRWDVENRLIALNWTGVNGSYSNPDYVYDPWGRRVWTDNSVGSPSFEAYFYGATGQKLESYNCTIPANGELSCALEGTNTYFAGKMISEKGVLVVTDRLGSVRGDSTATNFAYYPWGEERGTTAHTGRTLFAGYYRDAVGQDYAMARYYNATTGAFWSQDPGSINTADSKTPLSWNRYSYTYGDPVNFGDPSGMIQVSTGDGNCGPDWIWDSSLDGPCCDPSGNAFLGAAPNPACSTGSGGDAGPPQGPAKPTPPPTCSSEYGIPSADEAPQLAVLLGENSWGNYSASVVAQEDLYMEQAMYNYADPKGYATSSARVDMTINTDTYRGYPAGVSNLSTDLTSSASSSFCLDLVTAEGAYTQFWAGSKSISDVNQWRSASSHGPAGPGETQIGGTVFFYSPGAFYSPTRPVHRPTPPIKLPKPRNALDY